jgi:hypothetical protein
MSVLGCHKVGSWPGSTRAEPPNRPRAEQRLAADCLQRSLGPPFRFWLAPLVLRCRCPSTLGGADAARRQAAGAASYLAFPRCDQHRISWWVTPHTDHCAVDRAPALRRAVGLLERRSIVPVLRHACLRHTMRHP